MAIFETVATRRRRARVAAFRELLRSQLSSDPIYCDSTRLRAIPMKRGDGLLLLARNFLPILSVVVVVARGKEGSPSRDPVRTQNLPPVSLAPADGVSDNWFELESFASGSYLTRPEGQEVMVDIGRCKPDFFRAAAAQGNGRRTAGRTPPLIRQPRGV